MQISYKKLESILKKQSRVLIVRGESSYSLSGLENFFNNFNNINRAHYWVVRSKDPDLKEIEDLSSFISKIKPSIILSCGGGTVIDTAKAASFLFRQSFDLLSLIEGKRKQDSQKILDIAIPTTCGTGSESTHFSVIYVDNVKYSLADQSMKPDSFYLDGSFLVNLPSKHLISSSLDAFSQSIESYWAQSSTKESKVLSCEGMALFSENYKSLLSSNNLNQLNSMLVCANKAGKAINITKTTAPHAISYYLSKSLNLPHGFSVFLTLPEIFEFTLSKIIVYKDKLDVEKIFKSLGVANLDDSLIYLEKIRQEAATYMNLPNLSLVEIEDLALRASESVNQERLSNHPIVLDKEVIFQLTCKGLKKIFL